MPLNNSAALPEVVVALTDGATIDTDASSGDVFSVTIAGDRTLNPPTNPRDGQKAVWRVKASGAGRTLTLSSAAGGFRFGSDITSLSQVASGKTDYIGAIYNSADGKWDVIAYSKGY